MKTLNFLTGKVIFLVIILLITCPELTGQHASIRDAGKNTGDINSLQSKSKQDEQWLFYTSENTGIPGSEIYRAIVDAYDNVWVDTNGGLVRFDGKVWTAFSTWSSYLAISALAVDNYGKIWVATVDGALTRYDGGSEELMIEPGSGMFDGYISAITFDNDNNIWFSTLLPDEEEELSWFSCLESRLVKVEGLAVSDEPVWTFHDNAELSTFFIAEMAFDNTGNLWLNYSKGYLVKFDGSQFTEYNIFGIAGIGLHFSFTIDQDNIIWSGDQQGTLIKFDGINSEVIEPGFPDTGQPRFDYHEFKRLAVDDNNNLWIGADVGMIKYNGNSWLYYELETGIRSFDFESDGSVWASGLYGLYVLRTGDDPELYGSAGYKITYYGIDNTGLLDNYISAIQTDSCGNSWIGMFDNGLARFDGAVWTTFCDSESDLPDNQVRAVTSDGDNNIWIGTRDGLAMIPAISIEGQSWPVYNTGNSGLPANSVSCLHYANNNLWVGTALGLTRSHDQVWTTFNTANSGLPHNDIRSILTDSNGNIWIGTYGGGLARIAALSLNEPDWEIFNTSNSDLPDNMIFALEADSNGNIWIGTAYNGLVKYDGDDFTFYDTDNSQLPDDHIESLKLDDEGNIWVGMRYGGVSEFDGTVWTNHGTVLEGAVYTIDVDRYGNKWIGFAGGGVAVYNETGIASRNDLRLSGHIFLDGGDTPLEESAVEIYPLDSANYSEKIVLSGSSEYEFTELCYGLYTLKITPDTLSYPATLPTWLGYKLTRADASYISLNKNITDADITVIKRPDPGSGTGTVTGSLLAVSTVKNGMALTGYGDKNGTPLADCYVFLLDAGDGSVKAYDITSPEGEFVFANLEVGEYIFSADYKDKHMNSSNPLLEVGGDNDSIHIDAVAGVETIDIQVEVISNIEKIHKASLKVYPVPVKEILTISLMNDPSPGRIESIKIIGLDGRVLYEQNKAVSCGSDIYIDMGLFRPGIYLLQIKTGENLYKLKIIKN
jgi:ligand-binding sensor domain-containing protein